VDFADACLQGGARLLQIRAKHVSGRDLLAMTEQVVARASRDDALVIVNDRGDVARIAGAGGVHVGQDDLAPALVRTIVGPRAVIGLSTHTADQVESALTEPINHLAIGPGFGTTTKDTSYPPVGLDRVREVVERASASRLGVVAIGGITLDRARAVLDAGADAVAVISDLLVTGNPADRVRAYLHALAR
jgi:thiamine-phosphate pyrophosphorylase